MSELREILIGFGLAIALIGVVLLVAGRVGLPLLRPAAGRHRLQRKNFLFLHSAWHVDPDQHGAVCALLPDLSHASLSEIRRNPRGVVGSLHD